MHSRATDRKSASKCQGKWPDQTLDQAFGLPEVLVAVSTSRLSCKRAGKTRTLMPVWDSSGESRLMGVHLENLGRNGTPDDIRPARWRSRRLLAKVARTIDRWHHHIAAVSSRCSHSVCSDIRPNPARSRTRLHE